MYKSLVGCCLNAFDLNNFLVVVGPLSLQACVLRGQKRRDTSAEAPLGALGFCVPGWAWVLRHICRKLCWKLDGSLVPTALPVAVC